MKVSWAETLLVLNDKFREGNVSPRKDIKRVVDKAFDRLPPRKWKVKVRSDSAAYDQNVLDHWEGRQWDFAVSAEMHQQFKQEIELLPDNAWQYVESHPKRLRFMIFTPIGKLVRYAG